MVAAVYPSRSVERVVFAERFESYAKVHANGGVLTGAPVVDAAGIHLDGLTQFSTHAISAGQLAHPEISFECRFTPYFNWDDSLSHVLVDTTGGYFRFFKAGNNDFYIYLGGVLVAIIASATYAPHWNVDQKNSLIISGTSGSTSAWLNEANILSNDISVWNIQSPTELYIGATNGGASKFDGIIHNLTVRSRLLSALDVAAIQSNSLYTYMNRSSCFYDMAEATEIGGLKQTLDKSAHGRVCLLGDGTTAADIPGFENPGFSLDGVNQYMEILDGSFLYEDALSLVSVFGPDYGEVTPAHKFLFDDSTGLKYSVLKVSSGGVQFFAGGFAAGASAAEIAPHWRINGLNVLICTASPTTMNTTLNGCLLTSTPNMYSKVAVTSMNLWRRKNDTQHHSGKGNGFMAFPFVLSPLQAEDLTLALGVIP